MIRKINVMLFVGVVTSACGTGSKMDAPAAWEGSNDIVQATTTGSEALRRCLDAGPTTDMCAHAQEAFDQIADDAKEIQKNAANAGGARK